MRADVETAHRAMKQRIGVGQEIKSLDAMVTTDEVVQRITGGTYAGGAGLLVLTTERVLFFRTHTRNNVEKSWPLAEVHDVAWKAGFAAGTLTLSAGRFTESFGSVPKADGAAMFDAVRSLTAA